MIYIFVHEDDFNKNHKIGSYAQGIRHDAYHLLKFMVDEVPKELDDYCRYTSEEAYEIVQLINNNQQFKYKKTKEILTLPLASNKLEDGSRLYTRIFGVCMQCPQNQTTSIELTVPYDHCKWSGIDIVGASNAKVDIELLDTSTGTYTSQPLWKLDAFASNVAIKGNTFTKESAYPANIYKDMILSVKVTNKNPTEEVCVNFHLHEVVRS